MEPVLYLRTQHHRVILGDFGDTIEIYSRPKSQGGLQRMGPEAFRLSPIPATRLGCSQKTHTNCRQFPFALVARSASQTELPDQSDPANETRGANG